MKHRACPTVLSPAPIFGRSSRASHNIQQKWTPQNLECSFALSQAGEVTRHVSDGQQCS